MQGDYGVRFLATGNIHMLYSHLYADRTALLAFCLQPPVENEDGCRVLDAGKNDTRHGAPHDRKKTQSR